MAEEVEQEVAPVVPVSSHTPWTRADDGEDVRALRAEVERLAEMVEEALRPPKPQAFLRMVRDAIDRGAQSADVPEARWCVVVVPDTGDSECKKFATEDDLVSFLRTVHGQDNVCVFPFYGRVCGITPGGGFLMTHNQRHSLFNADDPDEIDPSGRMGRKGPELEPTAEDDETPEEDDDDGREDDEEEAGEDE